MRIGFDLDGVIAECSIPEWLLMGAVENGKKRETIREFLHSSPKLKFHPREFLHEGDEYIIITGRDRRFEEITNKWLESHGIHTLIYFCDVGTADEYPSLAEFFYAHAKMKARYIKSECIDVFFEDAPEIVKRLRELCPKTIIIQVGGRIK